MRREGRTGEQPLPPEDAEENVDPGQGQMDVDPSRRPRDADGDILTDDDGAGVAGGTHGSSGGGSGMPGHPDATG